ncbi:MAG: hypothetical protein OES09_08650, partial [Gammaproteobacteria bacterium]|nr:hypothetical protein [Gammaproteobacteria bacterium]
LAQYIAATDREAARNTYKKAERLCGDIGAMVDYARGAKSVFGDDEWVAEILGGVEVDCQFPKEFVALAGGYRELLGRDDKVDELLESGAEFAMSGEEYVDLAKGYWELKNDAEQATSFFEKALDEVGDRGQLLDLASMLINELDAKAVAKKFYAKASEKTTVAGDFVKLAQTVAAELVDRDYAAEVYQQAEAKVTGAHDLINLANAITTDLEDTAWATKLFQKALVQTDDFPGLNKLLDAVTASNTSVDEALARPLLDKLAATAQTTRELIAARDRAMDVLGDQQAGARMLELAEDRVTSLEEMRSLAQAVEQHSPEDNEWNTRVAEKLAKREANQEKYAVIQKRESGCTSSRQLIGLAEEVNRELDDKFYARKLLMAAADALANETFDFSKLRLLIIAVDATLGDSNWLSELYDKAASHCSDFACVAQVARSAVSDVSDTALGESLCRKILRQYESSCSNWTFYQAAKFAGAIDRNTGDQEWARKLLNRAETLGGDHLDLAYLGNLAQRLGDQQRAQSLFDRAAGHCQRASDAAQLGFRLQRYGLPADKIRNLYLSTKDRMATGLEKLHWAEGILDVFGDETWARDVYEGLSAEFTDPRERTVYLASRQHRLERRV